MDWGMSKGETKIAQLLKKSNISFQKEYTFANLKKGKYRFDFYLPNKNCIIEFHGEQHYQYINFFYKNISDFRRAQENDRKKISYCLAHGITMYCVPYWELDNLNTANDIFQSHFIPKNRFHNDEEWRKKQNE